MATAPAQTKRVESKAVGQSLLSRVLLYAVLILFALFFLLPLLWMLVTSIKPQGEWLLTNWIPRNPTLQQDPTRLHDWLRGGLLLQITAGSVLGQMGRRARSMAHDLLEKRWVHFIATDAHNTTTRPPRMLAAHDGVAERYGEEYAHLLCVSNPLAAFQGRPLGPQPEPAGLVIETAVEWFMGHLPAVSPLFIICAVCH